MSITKIRATFNSSFCAYPLFHRTRGNIFRNFKVRGSKKFKKRGRGNLPQKVCFLKQGRLNLRATHLQENHEQEQPFAAVLQNKCS